MDGPVAHDGHDLVARARASGAQLVRFLYCDNGNLIRGKAAHLSALADAVETGIGLTVAMAGFTLAEQLAAGTGQGPVGEIRLVPDPRTFRPLPYNRRQARVLCDMVTLEGALWEAYPRTFLRRMIAKAAAAGIEAQAAFEYEFYLARRTPDGFEPWDDSVCFGSAGMDSASAIVDELLESLVEQGIEPRQYYPELGPGQQELSVAHGPILGTADTSIAVRETVRAVAAEHGAVASFAPKPFPDQAGSGMHVHLSLWREGRNLLYAPEGPLGISPLGLQFIAGVLEHAPGLLALTCPSVNSYSRLAPGMWSSAYSCYGFDNREATVRVPSRFRGIEEASTNLEIKAVDGSANPYLALGGLLAAGLDGIERGLEPGEPVDVNPAELSEAERDRRKIRRYPQTLGQAIAALKDDQILLDALGPTLARELLAVRTSEWETFRERPAIEVARAHFHRY
ncbi:MAG TPA: glutamine synthetase family protein [Dehalococcoidia bacterium]|nr:glutamine synthetase family protein [Dehalococcoidia bacterium]